MLVFYLSVSTQVASLALVQDKDGVQRPVYYASRAYQGAKARYLCVEQLAFTLVVATLKLCLCFQAHLVTVLNEIPLKKILQRSDASGHLTNRAMELSEFDIGYIPWNSVKGQVLADFVAEYARFPKEAEYTTPMKLWHVFIDCSSYWVGGGMGLHIVTDMGEKYNYAIKLAFKITNNKAEYKALLFDLTIAKSLDAE